MSESLTQILVKAYEGLATAQDIRQYLNHQLSEKGSLVVTWQTVEAFKLSLNSFSHSTEPDEELLDVLFDSFNYIIGNSSNDDSWSNFSFELSNLTTRFLSVLEKAQQYEYFFCKLLTTLGDICTHNTEVWKSVSRQLLNIFINKKFSFNYFQDAVKLYISLLQTIDPSELHNFALKNIDLLKNFSLLVQSVGDFESQSFILEVVFLHILDKKSLADEFFVGKNKSVAECFRNLTFKNFETDCRIFLNEVNESLGSERKVITINCNQFYIGGKYLSASTEDECIWLDANLESRRLSITCALFFESETVSAGGRCVIFLPEGNLKDFKMQLGKTSGEDCHCFDMFFKDLKSSHQDLTSNDAKCTALHSSNSEKSIDDFKNALDSFVRVKCGVSQEKLLVEAGRNENNAVGESDELFMPVVKKKVQKQPDFLRDAEKKLQDNMISSSNHKPITSALDLFKDDAGDKKKPKNSYGICVGGGGVTDSFAISRTSDESRNSPVNARVRKILSSDESSPRRSSRLRNKTEVNYSKEKILGSPKGEKHSDKEGSSNEKKGRGRASKANKLFSSQENAAQTFNDGPSPPEKEAVMPPPKKYLENSFSRQRKLKGDDNNNKKSSIKKEVKNTSLLDPNGYAYKRWSGGETSKRGQFWLDKLKKLQGKNANGTESVYDFSDEESKYFKNTKKKPAASKNKRKSSIKAVPKCLESSEDELKKDTSKRKTVRKKPAQRPALKISKAIEKKVKEKPKQKPKSKKDLKLDVSTDIIENTLSDSIEEEIVKEPKKNPEERKSGKNFQKNEPKKVSKDSESEKICKELKSGKVLEEREPENVVEEPEPAEIPIGTKSGKVLKETEPEKIVREPEPAKIPKGTKSGNVLQEKELEKIFEEQELKERFEEPQPVNGFEERFEVPEPEQVFEETEPEKVFEEDPEITFEESKLEKILQEANAKQVQEVEIFEKNIPTGKENYDRLIVKELSDLNSECDPNLLFTKIDFTQSGLIKVIQTNSRSHFEKLKNTKENANEILTLIGNEKENEIPTSSTRKAEKENENPILVENKKRPVSSSDEISSSPHFSVKSRVNYPINRKKRFRKQRKSQKRKSTPRKESSSSDEGNVKPTAPPKVIVKSNPSPRMAEPLKSSKRKLKESSEEEFSEPELSPKKDATPSFISALKQRNRQKVKSDTDRIVQTVNHATSGFLKSIYKKKSNKTDDFSSYVEKVMPGNSHENEFEKRFNRLERCVTYFQSGCAVSELCEDMNESITKAQECVKGTSSDETSNVEEEKLQVFSTRLEGIIKCDTEKELKNQLQTMATKMFSILSFDL